MRTLVGVALSLALAGCAGASADLDAKLPDGTSFARAVFQASTEGACVNTWVSFSKPDGNGGYTPVKTAIINHGLIGNTAIGHVDVPPGNYHVAGASCINSNHSSIHFTGKTAGPAALFEQPKVLATLGTIEVGAGEVVDIGSLTFIRVHSDYRRHDSVMLVAPNSTKDLDALRASNASIAAKLVTRHAKSTATPEDLAATEARLAASKPYGIYKAIVELQLTMVRSARAAGNGNVVR